MGDFSLKAFLSLDPHRVIKIPPQRSPAPLATSGKRRVISIDVARYPFYYQRPISKTI